MEAHPGYAYVEVTDGSIAIYESSFTEACYRVATYEIVSEADGVYGIREEGAEEPITMVVNVLDEDRIQVTYDEVTSGFVRSEMDVSTLAACALED